MCSWRSEILWWWNGLTDDVSDGLSLAEESDDFDGLKARLIDGKQVGTFHGLFDGDVDGILVGNKGWVVGDIVGLLDGEIQGICNWLSVGSIVDEL